MKASVGGDRHRQLKQFAIKEAVRIWGDRVFVVTQEVEKFKLEVELGIGYQTASAAKEITPDMGFLLADGVESKHEDRWERKHYINPQLVIVECENSRQSTLLRGTPSVRLYGYLLLKERYKRDRKEHRPIFVLVTWEGNRDAYKDIGLWDHVWFVPGEGSDEEVPADAPVEVGDGVPHTDGTT